MPVAQVSLLTLQAVQGSSRLLLLFVRLLVNLLRHGLNPLQIQYSTNRRESRSVGPSSRAATGSRLQMLEKIDESEQEEEDFVYANRQSRAFEELSH